MKIRLILPILFLMVLSGVSIAQNMLPLPPYQNTFTSSLTRGYWFTAPVDLEITEVGVPTDVGAGNQNIVIVTMAAAPPSWPGNTSTYTTEFLTQNDPTAGMIVIPVPIFVPAGTVIGVLGGRTSGGSIANSYAAAGAFNTTLLGQPVTLARFLTQTNIQNTWPNPVSQEPAGNIGRVNLTVQLPGGAPCDIAITNITSTATCGNDGTITVTAASSNPPITYSITGPVNQTNNDGNFTGLPAGTYNVNVVDAFPGPPACQASGTATVAGDVTPPVIVCPPNIFGLVCGDPFPEALTVADFVAQGGAAIDDCSSLNEMTIFSQLSVVGDFCSNGDPVVATRTYFVLDAAGNIATCTQTYSYIETATAPVITSILPPCYKYCGNLVNPAETDITYDTSCDLGATVIINGPQIIGPENCPGTIYRFSYTVIDDCGASSQSANRDFIIGNNGPTIECPPFNLLLECGDPNNQDYIDAHLALATANTSCDLGVTITDNYVPIFGTPCVGTRVVTFKATDDCGRTATCTTTITILDTTAPEITSTYQAGQCDEIECSGDVNGWFNIWMDKVEENLSATDNCQNVFWSTIPSNPQPNQDCSNGEQAITWVTWVARDNCGNESEVSYYFKVLDNTAPVFTFVPADANIACNEAPVFGTPSVSDACNTFILTFEDTADDDDSCSGSYTRTWTAIDECGNASTAAQTLSYEDVDGPVITGGSDLTAECDGMGNLDDLAAALANQAGATATDACDNGVTWTNDFDPANIIVDNDCAGGVIAYVYVTFTATDDCGNASSVTFLFEALDTTPPDAPAPPADVNVQCASDVPPPVDLTASDMCVGDITVSPSAVITPGNCDNQFVMVRTWTFIDNCGNQSSVSQTITVNDTTPPDAPAPPADVNVQCASDVPPPVDLTANDNCDGDITVSPSAVITPGNCDNQFVMVRTWTFVDGCGNQSSVSQTINVNDTTPPDAPAPPADVNVQCASDVPPPVDLTANDNCDGDITVSPSAVITPGNCDNQFTMVRTWTFVDGCGNASSVSQTIQVNDTTPPDAPAPPADVNVQCAEDVPPPVDLTANDNCDGDITVSPSAVITPGNCDDQFTMVRTWTFVDGCGNQSSVSQTIIVNDDTAPEFTFVPADYESGCIQDNTVTTYAQICASSDDAEEDDDNGEVDLTSSDLELIEDDSQDKEVKVGLRFKDLHIPAGATITSAWIQFTAAASIDIDPSELEIFGQDSNNASTFTEEDEDITDRPKTSASTEWEPGDWEVVGDNHEAQRTPDLSEIVQEIVDRGGYTSESALAFIICGEGKRTAYSYDGSPEQAPELYVTYEVDPWGTPEASDNCSNVTITQEDTMDNDDGCAGSYTRTWTATDECGNASTAAQTIHFFDNVPPVFTYVPPHMNVSCDDFDFPPSFDTPIAVDNCDDVTITFEDYFVTGDEDSCDEDDEDSDYRRQWTATDGCGNTTTAVKRYNVKESYATFGIVATEENITVEDVTVSLEGFGGITQMSQTAADGIYSFEYLELGQNYAVTPMLDQDPLNGVSSFDLVLISKHILATQQLDSPYKMIAADVNKSGSITTLDLVELRKLILHIDENFQNNTSWRFVESAFVFPQPNNPFVSSFPEEVFINGLTENEIHDFVGVKVGDVNGSVVANAQAAADDRTVVSDLVFDVADQQLKAGQTYEVNFQANNFEAIHGYQFTLNFDQSALQFEGLQAGDLINLSDNNFGLALLEEGVITTSWTNKEAHSVSSGTGLFQVSFTANKDVLLSEVLNISSRYTNAEAYDSNLELMDVQLRFEDGITASKQYRLYQNTPNPFGQETVIGFELPEDMTATITILDISGRQLKQVTADYTKGYNQVSVDRNELTGSGMYYYQLVTDSFEETKKMIMKL